MDIRPVDLPQLRDEVVTGMRAFHYVGMIREWIRTRGNTHPTHGALTAEQLAEFEASSLAGADLFFVADQMTDLAKVAAQSLPDFEIQPEDVPSRNGLMLLAGELPQVQHGEPPLDYLVRGYSWVELDGQGVLLSPFTDRDSMLDSLSLAGVISPLDEKHSRLQMSRVVPMAAHWTWCPYGARVLDVGTQTIADALNVVRTAWLLMSQPIATTEDAAYDRAAWRRFQRQGTEPPRVRVITLRRAAGASTEAGASDREYHHQWIVRGHWRQQWYPVRQVHRPVWIAPHIKGPEGAPLLGGEKVYALRR